MKMLAQVNSQLGPRTSRRQPGLGAAPTVVLPRHGWSATLGNAAAFIALGGPVPIPLQAGRAITNLAVDTNGNITVSGVYQGSTPYTMPNEFYFSGDKFPVISSSTTAFPAPPCVSGELLFNGQCLPRGNQGGGIVLNGGGGGAGGSIKGTVPAGKVVLQHGDLVRMTITAQGATLPPTYQQVAPSTVQGWLDARANSKGAYTVQSVVYKDAGTVVVEMLRNGPTVEQASPVPETTDGVACSTTFEDLGAPPSSGSSKIVYYVAGGAVVYGLGYLAWRKYGKKRR